MEYLRRAAQDPKNNYLAIQISLTDDGVQSKCEWPDDPLVAQRLFAELEFQYKSRLIDSTAVQRDAIREAQDKRILPANGATLDALTKHTGS